MAYLRSVDMPFLFQLQFTGFSVLWMLFSLLLGIAYAFFLYRGKRELSKNLARLLFTLRTLVVAIIAFLLFAPFIKLIDKKLEKPLILILQDNSASISVSQPRNFSLSGYTKQIRDLQASFGNDYEVKTITLGSTVRQGLNVSYKDPATDISSGFRYVTERFANKNLGAIILATDGIYNKGGNPQYEALNLKAPVYAVALGDTTPKKDLLISNINYNNIVYLGNSFQVEINVEAYQSKGTQSKISVSDKSGTVFTQPLSINSREYRHTIPVMLSAKQKGIQRFTVNLSPINGELSKQNNTQTFFVEVIDGRQKIFILANSPHPDLAAFKQSIEINRNYEVKTGFAGMFKVDDAANADLIILHQLPSASFGLENVSSISKGKNVLFVLGAQSNIPGFSASQNVLSITGTGSSQESAAKVNPDFFEFVLSEQTKGNLQNFDPLITPFGNYGLKSQSSVLLYQQIGKVATDRPLLVFSKEGSRKSAVLAGEGIWRWRLEDFKENGNHKTVDELVGKLVQYLAGKEDKRKFRIYPAKNTFDESEHVVLNAELYNDAYELVNQPEAGITLKHSSGKRYPFQFSRTGSSYILDAGILPAGEYSFSGSTQLGKVKHSASGQFIVTQQQAELRQTTADHQLLNTIAKQSGGEMVYPNELETIPGRIKKNELVKTISYEDRRFDELINNKLIFFLILLLISGEWFLRKRNGEL